MITTIIVSANVCLIIAAVAFTCLSQQRRRIAELRRTNYELNTMLEARQRTTVRRLCLEIQKRA